MLTQPLALHVHASITVKQKVCIVPTILVTIVIVFNKRLWPHNGCSANAMAVACAVAAIFLAHTASATKTKYELEYFAQRGYAFERAMHDCQTCLRTLKFQPSDITYLAAAKAGSRTVRDYLCSCINDHTCARSCKQHHCHRCTVRMLVDRGAKHIIIPLRHPHERLHSLIRFMWNTSNIQTIVKTIRLSLNSIVDQQMINANDVMSMYLNPTLHAQIAKALPFAYQTYEFYMHNATNGSLLRYVCVGRHMSQQYNAAIRSFGGPPTMLTHHYANQYSQNASASHEFTFHRDVTFRELLLEKFLWEKHCTDT